MVSSSSEAIDIGSVAARIAPITNQILFRAGSQLFRKYSIYSKAVFLIVFLQLYDVSVHHDFTAKRRANDQQCRFLHNK